MFRTSILTVACSAMLVGAACSRALDDENRADDQRVAGTATDSDTASDVEQFVEQAAIANIAEIQFGQLASQRAQHNDVKQFAGMMVTDHTKGLDDLRTAAQNVSATLPADLDDKYHDLYQGLSGMQGAEFDREYMKAMVDGHEDLADLLGSRAQGHNGSVAPEATDASATAGEARTGAPVNEWAATALPTVRAHLDRAKAISAKLK